MDFEPEDEDIAEALVRETARRDLALLPEQCREQSPVELLVHWGDDGLAAVPQAAIVRQVMAHPRAFRGEEP